MKKQPLRSTDRIQTVTAREFARVVLGSPGPAAVEFMSYSCAYCQALEPVIRQVAEHLGTQMTIVRVNIALDPELAAQYRVQATPTLVMFLNGQAIGRIEGPHPSFFSLLAAVTDPFPALNQG